jgi:hypothetical protein
MRVVLYDMLIAEAMIETMPESYPTHDEKLSVYNAVFAKHHITQAEYDSTLIWYGKNMDLYMAVYKLVLRDVNASIAALGDIKPNPSSGDVSGYDSIDIWIDRRYDVFKPQRFFNTLVFDVSPEKPYSPGSSYALRLSVWGIPPDLKHNPKIHISVLQADTIIFMNQEITGDGYYETIVNSSAAKDVTRIYGYIFMNITDATYHRIYLNDIRLMKYKDGSLREPQRPEMSHGHGVVSKCATSPVAEALEAKRRNSAQTIAVAMATFSDSVLL